MPRLSDTTPAVAAFLQVLGRYGSGASPGSQSETEIAKALTSEPEAQRHLSRFVARWSNPTRAPDEDRVAIISALSRPDSISDERLLKLMEPVLTRPLNSVAPGIRVAMPVVQGDGIETPVFAPLMAPAPSPFETAASAAEAVVEAVEDALASGTAPTPRFQIEFAGIYCKKETDWDQGSVHDEPYVLFTITQRFREPWSRRSWVYENLPGGADGIDSGDDFRELPPLLTLFGESGPEPAEETAVVTAFMEHDHGNPDHYKEEIRLFVKAAQAYAAANGIPVPDAVANLAVEGINKLLHTEDDLIGVDTVVLSPQAFHNWSNQPLIKFKQQLKYHFFTHHVGGTADYYAMYRIKQDGKDWAQPVAALSSSPAASSWAPGNIDIFSRAEKSALWHSWWDGQKWSNFENLGGIVTEAPAAVARQQNYVDVFARGKDKALWTLWWDGQKWSDWVRLGGVLKYGPAASSYAPNNIDVFYIGQNNALWHMWWDGQNWSHEEDLSGILTSGPAAVARQQNYVDVFARGKDRALWTIWWDGQKWSDWVRLGGDLKSGPAASSYAPNNIDVFYIGQNNALWHMWWDGQNWSHEEDLGGILTSGPAAVARQKNYVDVFAPGQDKTLWTKWWDGQKWSEWIQLNLRRPPG